MVPALAFVGPFQAGQPMATGVVVQLTTINANAQTTVTHGLYRIPVYSQMLANPPNFKGDIEIVSATSTTAVVRVSQTTSPASFAYMT